MIGTTMRDTDTRIIGIICVIAGCLGLAYGGFSYTKESTGLKIGSLELKMNEKQDVSIPTVLSGGIVALGVLLIVVGGRR